eukprot:scaffold656_cov271-Chaetoceros_neogracile.AAC.11
MNDFIDGDSTNDDDNEFEFGPNAGGASSWEIQVPAPSSVQEHLRGLLWKVSKYQDGVCSDYGYKYGRRMCPTTE